MSCFLQANTLVAHLFVLKDREKNKRAAPTTQNKKPRHKKLSEAK